MAVKKKVKDWARGRATNQYFDSSSTPTDYTTPSDGDNPWQQFSDVNDVVLEQGPVGGSFIATAEINDPIAGIPLGIVDDIEVDGNDIIIWTIDADALFGFAEDTFIFNESDDPSSSGTTVNPTVDLSEESSIKTAVIIIEDNDSPLPNTIEGNSNNNSLEGEEDNDVIYAQGGNDQVDGEEGNDDLFGQAGNDTIEGDSGNDYLNGGSGKDKLYGEAGNDILDGLGSDDTLEGNEGDDTLRGWNGEDKLTGGEGDDYLVGDLGNDTLRGGEDADKFVFYSLEEGIDVIKDFQQTEGDTIEIHKTEFETEIGALSLDQFIYNSSTGALSFDPLNGLAPVQFATLENKPTEFNPSSAITLVSSSF